MKKPNDKVTKLVTKAKWVLYSGTALSTVLMFAALADPPKTPLWCGE